MFEVVNHILHKGGKPVAQHPSPNHGGIIHPRILVYHYTAIGTAGPAINTLSDAHAANRVSAHLVLDRDGAVTQLLPLNVKGWHVGRSEYPRGEDGATPNVNDFSIGIEMVNCGVLNKRGDGTFVDQLQHKIIPPDDVVHAEHRITHGVAYWQTYTPVQIQAASDIGVAIMAAYRLEDAVGHEDVCLPVGRKTDPGPSFPLNVVQARVLGRS